MKMIIKSTNEYGEKNGKSFEFNSETWRRIGSTGSGGEGHYSQQGVRVLYASPKKSPALGRHRFVVYGTGYYPVIEGGSLGNGGLSWGKEAHEVDESTAFAIADPELISEYFESPEKLD